MLDLRYLALPDADALGELRLSQPCLFAQLPESVGSNFREHACLVRFYFRTISGILLHEFFKTQCHRDHLHFNETM